MQLGLLCHSGLKADLHEPVHPGNGRPIGILSRLTSNGWCHDVYRHLKCTQCASKNWCDATDYINIMGYAWCIAGGKRLFGVYGLRFRRVFVVLSSPNSLVFGIILERFCCCWLQNATIMPIMSVASECR